MNLYYINNTPYNRVFVLKKYSGFIDLIQNGITVKLKLFVEGNFNLPINVITATLKIGNEEINNIPINRFGNSSSSYELSMSEHIELNYNNQFIEDKNNSMVSIWLDLDESKMNGLNVATNSVDKWRTEAYQSRFNLDINLGNSIKINEGIKVIPLSYQVDSSTVPSTILAKQWILEATSLLSKSKSPNIKDYVSLTTSEQLVGEIAEIKTTVVTKKQRISIDQENTLPFEIKSLTNRRIQLPIRTHIYDETNFEEEGLLTGGLSSFVEVKVEFQNWIKLTTSLRTINLKWVEQLSLSNSFLNHEIKFLHNDQKLTVTKDFYFGVINEKSSLENY